MHKTDKIYIAGHRGLVGLRLAVGPVDVKCNYVKSRASLAIRLLTTKTIASIFHYINHSYGKQSSQVCFGRLNSQHTIADINL